MEVATCVQEISSHAVSLLASLNLQREQAQYCDCVVIQRLNPGQLYPAHRCILSASSPVLASILSSSGALVELQDPCLSDSVLAILLDYIYTGALSYTQSQQYNNLLSAARHLQMDELQETLKAWRQTEDVMQNVPCTTEAHVVSKVGKVGCLSSGLLKDQCHSIGTEPHQTWRESTEEEPVRIVEDRRSLNLCHSSELQEERKSELEKTQQLCLAVESKAEEEQNRKEEDNMQIRHSSLPHLSTSELKDNVCPLQCPSSSSSSLRPCCGAVPVIRHSSRASMPFYHPVSQASVSSSSLSGPSDSIVEGYPDHSDQSSDGEDVGTFTSQVSSPLRQHFARGTTEQVLLLDISSKPAELLVSYKHRSDRREDWIRYDHTDTFESGSGNTDREQWDEAGETQITAESFVEADSKSLVGEANVEERKPVGKAQNSPGVEVLHKVRTVEAGNQTTTLTVCSPPSVPEFVQGSVSSTLSVCIPSSLSGSMPTNISAHLSTPVHHPFQCYLCDRSFSQRGSLNRHVRSHLGVRPFPCPRCPMTFSRQYRVTEHMRVHQRFAFETDFQKSSTFDSK
uniref:hypermethylated in cancer 2 protein-like n=1 Tax=Semicossyphus pulcher TaxID=241346 RepID=UPI0037E8BC93